MSGCVQCFAISQANLLDLALCGANLDKLSTMVVAGETHQLTLVNRVSYQK